MVHHRVSCGFISTWHEHVVSHRSVSFCVVSSCVSHCHSTGRSSTAIADTCGAGISCSFHGSLRLHSTSEPVFGVTSQSTQKWGILSRNAFFQSFCFLWKKMSWFSLCSCSGSIAGEIPTKQQVILKWHSGIVAVWNWELGKHWNVIQGKNMEQLKNKCAESR